MKIVQIWIDVKKQLTISHIGPFINHPKYFFAGLIKNGETSHPLKNYFQNYCHKNKQFDLNKLLTTHFHEKNGKWFPNIYEFVIKIFRQKKPLTNYKQKTETGVSPNE